MDVRVSNPLAKNHFNQSLSSCYRKNEKKRACEERIRNFEHGTFIPLVFSVAGGMGPITTGKIHQSYNQIIHWFRCTLSFSLLIMCIRGARSSTGKP